MWEDKGNKDGGRWLLTLEKRDKKEGMLDAVWMETVSGWVCYSHNLQVFDLNPL